MLVPAFDTIRYLKTTTNATHHKKIIIIRIPFIEHTSNFKKYWLNINPTTADRRHKRPSYIIIWFIYNRPTSFTHLSYRIINLSMSATNIHYKMYILFTLYLTLMCLEYFERNSLKVNISLWVKRIV